MSVALKSFCRLCTAACPTVVEISEGQPVRISGDRTSTLYGGYTCVKGRGLPSVHRDPNRVLFSLRKDAAGEHRRISTDEALTEIADRLSGLIEQHGPRSVACYLGNAVVLYPSTASLAAMFMSAIRSPMLFDSMTVDQPGILVANALHGEWRGGRISTAEAEVALVVGGNPVISKQYFSQNPARQLKDGANAGMKLIVIDPRRTETARRAHVCLQPHAGEDVSILAGLLHLLISEDRVDADFVAANVDGLEALKESVARFTPEYVARRAGVDERDLREAARVLGEARTGYVAGGTGVGMTGHGNLAFYLLLCIQSVRGFWQRAGGNFTASAVLTPALEPKAQARAPWSPVAGETLRVRNLRGSVAGLPTSGLPDEILTPGDGQIRALICIANPLATWPNVLRTHEALSSLELLVVPNVEMSETTRLAHYVIATRQMLETPATTQLVEGIRKTIHPGYGWEVPYAQHTPALIDPPIDSDVIEEWQMFYRIAERMGYPLPLGVPDAGSAAGSGCREPSSEEVIDFLCRGAAVSVDDVRRGDGGNVYADAQQVVAPRDPGCSDRLNVADPIMMGELAKVAAEARDAQDAGYPYRLITRRLDGTFNSMHRRVPGYHRRPYNPAFMSPRDLAHLGLAPGDLIVIRSPAGAIKAVVDADETLRPGVISVSHGYGAATGEADDPHRHGSNVNRLLRMENAESITGMPQLGAIAVAVAALQPD